MRAFIILVLAVLIVVGCATKPKVNRCPQAVIVITPA